MHGLDERDLHAAELSPLIGGMDATGTGIQPTHQTRKSGANRVEFMLWRNGALRRPAAMPLFALL